MLTPSPMNMVRPPAVKLIRFNFQAKATLLRSDYFNIYEWLCRGRGERPQSQPGKPSLGSCFCLRLRRHSSTCTTQNHSRKSNRAIGKKRRWNTQSAAKTASLPQSVNHGKCSRCTSIIACCRRRPRVSPAAVLHASRNPRRPYNNDHCNMALTVRAIEPNNNGDATYPFVL